MNLAEHIASSAARKKIAWKIAIVSAFQLDRLTTRAMVHRACCHAYQPVRCRLFRPVGPGLGLASRSRYRSIATALFRPPTLMLARPSLQ